MRAFADAQHKKMDSVFTKMPQDLLAGIADLNKRSRGAEIACVSRNRMVEGAVKLLLDFGKTVRMINCALMDYIEYIDLCSKGLGKGDSISSCMGRSRCQVRSIQDFPEGKAFARRRRHLGADGQRWPAC